MKKLILILLVFYINNTANAQYMELFVKVITKNKKTHTGILLHPETNVIYKFKKGQNILATKNLFYQGQFSFELYQKIETCSKTAFVKDTINYPSVGGYQQPIKLGYYLENSVEGFDVKNVSKIIYQYKRRPKYNTAEVDFELVKVSPAMATIIQTKPLINQVIQTNLKSEIVDNDGNAFSMYNFNPAITENELRQLGELYKNQIFAIYYTNEKEKLATAEKAIAELQKKQIIIFRYYIGD